MKKYRVFFLLLNLLLCSIQPAFSCEESESVFLACNKTYIQPEQINFSNNEIYIQIDTLMFRTSGVHSDTEGLYFQDAEGGCGYLQKPCPRFGCPGCNFPWDTRCYACGKKLK